MKKMLSGKQLTWLMTFVYFTSYITRINFGAIIQEIITDTGFLKSELSIVLVGLSVFYGAGQLITGFLGDRVPPQLLIGVGLSLAAIINLIFPFVAGSRILMCVLWSCNGFCHAMMWPPMTKIMANTMDQKMYEYAVVRVSWGSSFGTIAIYLLAPLVLSFSGWRTVFWICGAIGLCMSALWFVLSQRINDRMTAEDRSAAVPATAEKKKLGRQFILPIVLIMLAIALQGMIRDGVTAWMPTYLSEVFQMKNSVSILSTVSLAVFSIVSFWLVGLVFARFFKNEVFCAALMFGLSALTAGIFYLFYDAGAILAILMMTLITGLMHGVNLVLIGYIPKHFRKMGKVSTISGLINSCTYVGASISTYVVARIAEVIGWRFNILIWMIITALGCVVCLIATKPWQRVALLEKERE